MGNPFVHIELNTDDVAKATKFYKALFDWKITAAPGMDYNMIDVGKTDEGGGIQLKQNAGPNAWLPYVEVDSISKTMDKAQKGGAMVALPRLDIAGMGSIGIFIDPTGAPLGIWQPAKKAAPAKKATPAKKAAAAKKKKPAKKAAAKKR